MPSQLDVTIHVRSHRRPAPGALTRPAPQSSSATPGATTRKWPPCPFQLRQVQDCHPRTRVEQHQAVGPNDVEPHAARLGGQQQHEGWVRRVVEGVHDGLPRLDGAAAVQAQGHPAVRAAHLGRGTEDGGQGAHRCEGRRSAWCAWHKLCAAFTWPLCGLIGRGGSMYARVRCRYQSQHLSAAGLCKTQAVKASALRPTPTAGR